MVALALLQKKSTKQHSEDKTDKSENINMSDRWSKRQDMVSVFDEQSVVRFHLAPFRYPTCYKAVRGFIAIALTSVYI